VQFSFLPPDPYMAGIGEESRGDLELPLLPQAGNTGASLNASVASGVSCSHPGKPFAIRTERSRLVRCRGPAHANHQGAVFVVAMMMVVAMKTRNALLTLGWGCAFRHAMMWCMHPPPSYTHANTSRFTHCLTWVQLHAPCTFSHTLLYRRVPYG
jgi:hypothetical protein